ncbi:MAG: ABC-type metal ion transporter, periplasmic subunit [Candidatus Magasanikbacteria bacterium]|nr:ABC-type metal ion transporter, periplasmic subunit [Candidatus Magasanikbacteria bacterium]
MSCCLEQERHLPVTIQLQLPISSFQLHPMSVRLLTTILILITAVGAVLAVAFKKTPTQNRGIKIVTTTYPLYIFSKNIAGENADVKNLLPNGVGPHEYAPTPSDIVALAEADIVVKSGVHLDDWLTPLLDATPSKTRTIIDASEFVTLLYAEQDSPETPTGSYDPHWWLNPVNTIAAVSGIGEILTQKDPAHAELYQANAAAYQEKLKKLDDRLRVKLKDAPKNLITFHPAFIYFVGRYGLKQLAVVEPSPGKDPTPQYLAELMSVIRANKVTTIFSEPQFSPRVMEVLAKDLQLSVRTLDPLETGPDVADAYQNIMWTNAAAILDADAQ